MKNGGSGTGNSLALEPDGGSRCGYGRCQPRWMQICNNSKVLLVLICVYGAIQSFVVNGINNVNTTSYERRFGLPSSSVGIISSAYDISAGIFVLPISYYGMSGHKGKLLSFALIIMAIGSFIMALPHFTTGIYELGQNSTFLCSTGNSTTFNGEEKGLSNYLYVLIGGQLLHGIGGTTLYTVGVAFIDDNVPSRSSPFYIGIMNAFVTLGPAVGYILGGYLLSIYVDFDVIDTDNLVLLESDPRWVGAWWIGFILAMAMAVLLILPLLALPRELPRAKEVQASRASEAHVPQGKPCSNGDTQMKNSLKNAPKMTCTLLRNPVLICIALGASSELLIVSGLATFTPKFIQNQYGRTASFAAIMAGALAIVGAAGGSVLGGYICRRFNLKVRGMLRLALGTCSISLLLIPAFWVHCSLDNIAGVNTPYSNSPTESTGVNLNSACNWGCGCSQRSYAPVCGADGVQYFSPCHAGCLSSQAQKYSACNCINATFPGHDHSAESGVCGESCSLMYVFLPLFFFVILFTFVAATPSTMSVLRCVPDSQKTYAIGVKWMFARFLGTVPGPILFGTVIDSVCIVWQDTSDESDSCWIYDNESMSRNFFFLSLGAKVVSTIFFFLAVVLYKASPVTEGENSPPVTKGENSSIELSVSNEADDTHVAGGKMFADDGKVGYDNPAMSVLNGEYTRL